MAAHEDQLLCSESRLLLSAVPHVKCHACMCSTGLSTWRLPSGLQLDHTSLSCMPDRHLELEVRTNTLNWLAMCINMNKHACDQACESTRELGLVRVFTCRNRTGAHAATAYSLADTLQSSVEPYLAGNIFKYRPSVTSAAATGFCAGKVGNEVRQECGHSAQDWDLCLGAAIDCSPVGSVVLCSCRHTTQVSCY